ncbi:MAG: NAD-dependent epimerase/dehydratase family protein [Ignavibacteriae bacterium]|nr:NAD-dependent epimerase/dehydratase family protein [Ignavibacteriota bacterium]
MKKRCLILGGGGFIGSHLADTLLEKNYDVVIFEKLNFSRNNINHILDKIKIIEGDFNNEIDLKNALKGIDIAFHLVSSTLPANSNENPIYDVETNLVSSLRFLNEAFINGISRIIFISSGGTVYGIPERLPIKEYHPRKPICSYGIIKKTIEDYLYMFGKLYGMDYYVFRLSNPYGERQNPNVAQGVIPVFLKKLIKGEQIEIWGDGSVERDYIYIKDVTGALVKSLDANPNERIFNLGSGRGYTLNDIIGIIEKVTKKKANVLYKEKRNIDVPVNVLDNKLISEKLDWKPLTEIEKGIEKTYQYLLKEIN